MLNKSSYKKRIIVASIGIMVVLILFVLVVEAPVLETQSVRIEVAEKRGGSIQKEQLNYQNTLPITHQCSTGGIALKADTSSMSIVSSETPTQESVTEEGKVPFFYEMNSEKIAQLSVEQQDSLLRVEEQFVEFYRANPSAYYNDSLWTNEVGNLRERIISAIGIDAFETLMR